MPQQNLSDALNKSCHCITLDKAQLKKALDQQRGEQGFADRLEASHPHLFCESATFIRASHLAEMKALIAATRRLATLNGYQQWAMRHADLTAQHPVPYDSVFFGYDFHIDSHGPHLIEINTNAGGGLLNAMLSQAQLSCCKEVSAFFQPGSTQPVEEHFYEMFLQEWLLARGDQPLRCIAIVDDNPEQQGMYPEFLLFKSLFEKHGLRALVVSPERLHIANGRLWCDDQLIDLVYSRLTDFYFASPVHAVLRQAWLEDIAVITPHPRAYALFADKRNLTLMSNPETLIALGVSDQDRAVLERCVPLTRAVNSLSAETLWADRKQYFFKPAQGFGSKAAYRGDKLTRKAFESLLEQGDYLIQAFSPPGQRNVQVDGNDSELKFDVRAYVYQGEIQLLAARVYQGQTTNMRTQGGGFSGVFLVPEPSL